MIIDMLTNPAFILSIIIGSWLIAFIDKYFLTHKHTMSSNELLERYFTLIKFKQKLRKEGKK